MKRLLLLVAFFAFACCLSAQGTLVVEPNPFDEDLQVNLADINAEPIANACVKNMTGQPINLRWERQIVNAPPEWEFRVCDINFCYSTASYTNVVAGGMPNIPVELNNGDVSNLDLHVLPRGVAGCAEVKINLSDAATPSTIITTATYSVCVNALTAVRESDKASIRVYPNPTSNFIALTRNGNVRQLWISNILGKRVKTFHASLNGRYDVSDMPDGIYLVSMVDLRGSIIKTVRISKRNPRP